jgi:23S rRNA (guanosine2251-2'-O)-methyltransferase
VVLAEGRLAAPLARIESLARRAGVRLERRPRRELDRLAKGERHQGVLAWAEPAREADLEDVLAEEPPPDLLLALDQVSDPGNLGSALRSAAACGVQAVVLPRHGSAGPGGVAGRRSAGALEHVRVVRPVNLARALERIRQAGMWVIGLEPGAPPLAEAFDLTRRVALVAGAEGTGMRRLTREGCDALAGIPMAGPPGSLNVAVACGVALYEVLRQRRARPVASRA